MLWQLEFSLLCKEVGSKGVKEIVDQMLEGDDITTKHPIWPKMFGDTQLLDPTKKAKDNVASMQTKGKEEEDDPYSLAVGEKNSKTFLSQSEGMLLAQDKGKNSS
jgi:hypothetical protein